MGFGTLFFGYFLLLNIAFFSYTDLISALIMAVGLQKLSSVNKNLQYGYFSSFAFALIGLYELIIQLIGLFGSALDESALLSYVAIPRYFVIAVISLFVLLGIKDVAFEVGLSPLAVKARNCAPFTLTVYCLLAVLEIPFVKGIDVKILAISGVLLLLASLITVGINLTVIYTSYMRICMPEELGDEDEETASRFEFVNKYREHTKEKQREYAEYKLEKMRKKASRKNKK